MAIKLSDFQNRLPNWKVEDVGQKPGELDRDDVCLKPADGGKVQAAAFEDAVEAFYNTPADSAPTAAADRIPVAEFEKRLVGWTVEDSGAEAGYLDRGDVVLQSTDNGAKTVVSFDDAEKAFRGPQLDGSAAGVRQALPVALKPKPSLESLLNTQLAAVHYTYKKAGVSDTDACYPFWLFNDHAKSLCKHPQGHLGGLHLWAPQKQVSDVFVTLKGSFEDAVKVAADRARNQALYSQAQAVVDLGDGDWAVCGLGPRSANATTVTTSYSIDGQMNCGGAVSACYDVTSVEKLESSLAAVVGAESVYDLRNVAASNS